MCNKLLTYLLTYLLVAFYRETNKELRDYNDETVSQKFYKMNICKYR